MRNRLLTGLLVIVLATMTTAFSVGCDDSENPPPPPPPEQPRQPASPQREQSQDSQEQPRDFGVRDGQEDTQAPSEQEDTPTW